MSGVLVTVWIHSDTEIQHDRGPLCTAFWPKPSSQRGLGPGSTCGLCLWPSNIPLTCTQLLAGPATRWVRGLVGKTAGGKATRSLEHPQRDLSQDRESNIPSRGSGGQPGGTFPIFFPTRFGARFLSLCSFDWSFPECGNQKV